MFCKSFSILIFYFIFLIQCSIHTDGFFIKFFKIVINFILHFIYLIKKLSSHYSNFFQNIFIKICKINILLKNYCVINGKFISTQCFHYFNNIIFVMNSFKNNSNFITKNTIIVKDFSLFFHFRMYV